LRRVLSKIQSLRISLIVCTLAPLVFSGCKPGSGPSDTIPQSAIEATILRRTIETNVEAAGDIQPEKQIDVKAEISARILKLHVKEGQRVETGAPLVDLDDTELRTEKAAAETEIGISQLELENAERNFEREEQLKARKLVTEQSYEDTRTARDIAQRRLTRSKQRLDNVLSRLDKTRILSPISGTILSLPVVEGQVVVAAASVSSGTPIMSIADLTRLIIKTHINQIDVARLSMGQPFEFTVDSASTTKMRGAIQSIAPISTIKNNVKGFAVELRIENPDPRLRPGMTADIVIPLDRIENVIAAPVAGVFTSGSNRVVFIKDGKKEPGEQPIEIGISNIEFVEVKSGLKENDTILLVRPENLPKR